jgi:hypothetical protein
MKIEVGIEKRHLIVFAAALIIIGAGFVIAGLNTMIPDPGHNISQMQNCTNDGEILKMVNGEWNCVTEGDPQVDLLTANKWCLANPSGTAINCTSDAPTGEGSYGVYVGVTSAFYNGQQVGGYAGGNAKCNSAFPGSRMCYAGDFTNGAPAGVRGWYNAFSYSTFLKTLEPIERVNIGDCVGWTSSSNQIGGPYWDSTYPFYSDCSLSQNILCCK